MPQTDAPTAYANRLRKLWVKFHLLRRLAELLGVFFRSIKRWEGVGRPTSSAIAEVVLRVEAAAIDRFWENAARRIIAARVPAYSPSARFRLSTPAAILSVQPTELRTA
jgi:hypothetical protein